MKFSEMQQLFYDLLRDPLRTNALWPLTLAKSLVNQGCRETALRLPLDEVRTLHKSKSVQAKKDTSAYKIEETPFSLTDFGREIAVFLTDGTQLRPCYRMRAEHVESLSPYYKPAKYDPGYYVNPDGTTARIHVLNVLPAPTADKDNGLKLVYLALPNVLSGDNDVSVLHPRFHELCVWFAVAIAGAKERLPDSPRYWQMWVDSLNAENARYGAPMPTPPPEREGQ